MSDATFAFPSESVHFSASACNIFRHYFYQHTLLIAYSSSVAQVREESNPRDNHP